MSLCSHNRHILFVSSFIFLMLFCFSINAKQTIIVDVFKTSQSESGQALTISGTLIAKKRSLLSPRIDGLITNVNVDAGSKVKKGDILMSLDSVLAEHELQQVKANVARAQADLAEAKRLVREAERLVANKHIPENELAIRQAQLKIKQAELSAIRANQANIEERIHRHNLIAPFSGVISNKYSEVGEWVSRGDEVLELVNLDQVRLDVNVPQERYADITINTPVTVSSDAYQNQKIAANIQAIVPVSNEQVRAFLVRITLDNPSLTLLPGTSAIAEFDIKSADRQSVLIPRDALLVNPDGGYNIFVINDGKAHRRSVIIDHLTQKGAHVSKGVAADELVVIRGNEMLQNDQSVTINQITH